MRLSKLSLSPQRLHLSALVDLGHAAREDVNDSLFGKRRVGQSNHGDDGLLFLPIFLQLGREKLAKPSDTFQCLPSPAVTHSMPTRSPVGHLRNPHVRVTSM